MGEAWFDPPPELPELLIKYIFTSEALSVQVHPSDAQTEAAGLGQQGKEECWLVLDAEPGAQIAIGFRETLSPAQLRQAIDAGSIGDVLAWHSVQPGDFFYIPANTVHAIGAGIGLVEVQQNSDITYRLYDYGRPRALHLEAGLAVADHGPYPPRHQQRLDFNQASLLCDGPYFRIDYLTHTAGQCARSGPALVLPLTPGVMVNQTPVPPGNCLLIDAAAQIDLGAGGTCLLVHRRAGR